MLGSTRTILKFSCNISSVQPLNCRSKKEGLGDLDVSMIEEALEPSSGDSSGRGTQRSEYHWASDVYPASNVSLRSVGWDNFVIIDLDTDKTFAEMDWRSAHTMLHEQAIYQHDASQYQVERLDYENRKAFVRHVKPDYYTTAETHTTVDVVKQDEESLLQNAGAWGVPFGLGEVSVVDKVVGFKKIRFHTHENVGFGEVHLPEMQMHTSSFWMTIPETFIQGRSEERTQIIDALRGLAMHIVAAASLMIDPRDLGRTLEIETTQHRCPAHQRGQGLIPPFSCTIQYRAELGWRRVCSMTGAHLCIER